MSGRSGRSGKMELRVGNKYRLGRKIGSGSFGDIFLGAYVVAPLPLKPCLPCEPAPLFLSPKSLSALSSRGTQKRVSLATVLCNSANYRLDYRCWF